MGGGVGGTEGRRRRGEFKRSALGRGEGVGGLGIWNISCNYL